MSGSSAFLGQFETAAAYPAAYLINKAGGVLGHPVDLKLTDDKNDPADAVLAVHRLLATTSNLAVVLGPLTTVAPTIVPILNKDHMTMMSVAGENEFNRSHFKYFWRNFPPDSANGVAMALWAKQHGYTRVATVFTSDAGAQGDLPGVLAGAKALGLSVVDKVTLQAGQPSYQSDAVGLLNHHPQAIFTETDPTTAATFYGELAQLEHNPIPIVGSQTTVVPTWLKPVSQAVGPAAFAKEFAGMAQAASKPNKADTVFKQALLASASHVPNPRQWIGNPFVESDFDAVIVPALAMVAAHSTNPAVYNSYIRAVTDPGPGKTVVYSYAMGKKLLLAGKKIQYVGAHGPIEFNQYHNAFGGYAVEIYKNGNLQITGSFSQKTIQAHVPSAG